MNEGRQRVQLSEVADAEILAFAALDRGQGYRRARAVRERFDCSVAQFLQRLFRVIDDDASLAIDAVTVVRLRARRDAIRSVRVPARAEMRGGAGTRNHREQTLPAQGAA